MTLNCILFCFECFKLNSYTQFCTSKKNVGLLNKLMNALNLWWYCYFFFS